MSRSDVPVRIEHVDAMLWPWRLHERWVPLITPKIGSQIAAGHAHTRNRFDLFFRPKALEVRKAPTDLRQRSTNCAAEHPADHHHDDLQAGLIVPGRQPAQADAECEEQQEDEFSHCRDLSRLAGFVSNSSGPAFRPNRQTV